MYPTLEVRWFFRGAIPHDVEGWFRGGPDRVDQQPPRSDQYLRLPDTQQLNVKMREGRIEIKQRIGDARTQTLHSRVAGIVEHWRKWSFALAEPGRAWLRTLSPASSWLTVRKERRLRTYGVRAGEIREARLTREPPAGGCELELTVIHVAEEAWWTLALEAFGEEPTLQKSLDVVGRHIFRSGEPPTLSVDHSLGYAAWLSRTARAEAA